MEIKQVDTKDLPSLADKIVNEALSIPDDQTRKDYLKEYLKDAPVLKALVRDKLEAMRPDEGRDVLLTSDHSVRVRGS